MVNIMSDSHTVFHNEISSQTQQTGHFAAGAEKKALPGDEYYLYRGVSFIDALNEAEPELILGLVRALDQGHFEFVGSSLLCLMAEYDCICSRESFEQIVGNFR